MQNMCDKDIMGYNEKQLTCEGDTHHTGAIRQGLAIQSQDNRNTRGHNTVYGQTFDSN